MSEFKKNENEIGSLWMRHGSKGEYMTGEVNGEKVVVFPVNSQNPKAPSWRILRSVPQGEKAEAKGRDIGGGFTQVSSDDIGF